MGDARLELVIHPAPGALPLRVPVTKAITTVGADPEADVRVAGVPARWAVIHSDPDALSVRFLAAGKRVRLAPGEQVSDAGVTLECAAAATAADAGLPVDALAADLAAAEDPESALDLLLGAALAATGAATGAIIIADGDAGSGYRVAVARDADGRARADAAELLSDTIVRDVLASGERLLLGDAAAHSRYAQVPSVVTMDLRSVVCLPMRAGGRTLGALYLGKHGAGEPFAERLRRDLEIAAALAIPLLAQLRRARVAPGDDALLGDAPAMQEVRRLVARVGPSDLGVLVLGASGTGKELVARALHAASRRAARPLVALNCAAVPESLLAAELFGYARGAFTGAAGDRQGLIEAAAGSTLFLDEVGDMPPPMQAALLRVLEQREVRRLGETTARPVDFRLIAATHRDLRAEVAAGRFREDLLFRLQEVTIDLPPLAARGDDIVLLAHVFLRQAEAQLGLPAHRLAPAAESALRAHPWPGNVRELRAAMRRAAVLADDRLIAAKDLSLSPSAHVSDPLGSLDRPLADARDDFIRRYVTAVVARCGGNRDDAARALGIGVRTLYRYLSD